MQQSVPCTPFATAADTPSTSPRPAITGAAAHRKCIDASHVFRAIDGARRRLDGFVRNPGKHALYAAKVLLKFRLLELQQCELGELIQWALASAYFRTLHQLLGIDVSLSVWVDQLTNDLVTSKAAVRQGTRVVNL